MSNNDRLADYIPVHERMTRFYQDHPQGKILTAIIEHERVEGFVIIRAEVYRDVADTSPSATGHAYESQTTGYVNKTSYIENCETSAVGRALANLGYEIKKGIASREEMQKVERMTPKPVASRNPTPEPDKPVVLSPVDRKALTEEITDYYKGIGWGEDNLKKMEVRLGTKSNAELVQIAADTRAKQTEARATA